jgi:AcrR family transcriptional regulator
MTSRTRRAQILDASLELAAAAGWSDLRLYQVADRLGLRLAALQAEFRDRDALANAWFERALEEVLAVPAAELDGRTPPERLLAVMKRWFVALAPHHRVTGEMLREKLYPGHPQHWVPLAFDLSRLIHWFLDAALIASTGPRRQLAEIGLTALFLKHLGGWLRDRDGDLGRLRAALQRDLERADRWLGRLPRPQKTMHQTAS